MENFPNDGKEKSKIILPGTENLGEEYEQDKKETEELISNVLNHIKEGIEILEEDKEYLTFMKENPENYSSEEVKKVEENIESMKVEISRANSLITDLTLSQVQINAYMEQLDGLQNRFKEIATNITPGQSN